MAENQKISKIALWAVLIMAVPWLWSWNILGEGVQGGHAEFLPSPLYPYTTWYPIEESGNIAPNGLIKSAVISLAYLVQAAFPVSIFGLLVFKVKSHLKAGAKKSESGEGV